MIARSSIKSAGFLLLGCWSCGGEDAGVVEFAGVFWTAKASDNITRSEAQDYCNSLDAGGRSDWRIPDSDEIRALVRGCPPVEIGGECDLAEWPPGGPCSGVCPWGCYLAEPFSEGCSLAWTAEGVLFNFAVAGFDSAFENSLGYTRCVSGDSLVPPALTPFVRYPCAEVDQGKPLCVFEVGSAEIPISGLGLADDADIQIYLLDAVNGEFLGCSGWDQGLAHIVVRQTDYLANASFVRDDAPIIVDDVATRDVRVVVVENDGDGCPALFEDEDVLGETVVSGDQIKNGERIMVAGTRFIRLGPP